MNEKKVKVKVCRMKTLDVMRERREEMRKITRLSKIVECT